MGDPVTATLIGGTLLEAVVGGEVATSQAEAVQQGFEYQAEQMEQNAGQERAVSQRKALETTKQKDLIVSRARAIAAADGGSSLDPSVVDIMGDLEAEGDYNRDLALYEGEKSARSLEQGASIKRYEGKQAIAAGKAKKKAGYVKAISNVAIGGMGGKDPSNSLMGKYGDSFFSGSKTKVNWNDGTTGYY